MTRSPCVCCQTSVVCGFLFENPAIRICRGCRDSWLTYLYSIGFVMADTEWLIRELCENSHYVEDAWWSYYNNITKTRGDILRLAK